jgi:hypothetical protein
LVQSERWADAIPLAERRVALRREVHTALNRAESRGKLASALGSLGFYYLFAKQTEKALAAEKEANALDSEALWIRMNLAHALLLSDHLEEAKQIYLGNLSTRVNDRAFADECRNDFRLFRKAGLHDPRLAQIEALLPPEEKKAADGPAPEALSETPSEPAPQVEQRSGPP